MKLVLATRNRDKIREINAILSDVEVETGTLDSYPDFPETVEDGATLEANALKKAREARDHTGLSALADDTGLEVDALNGAPGIFAARFAGEDATYADNCNKLLQELEAVPRSERGAHFRTVMALALSRDDRERLEKLLEGRVEVEGLRREGGSVEAPVTEGRLRGEITAQALGVRGFGYDPVFFEPRAGKSLAQMTPEEKNSTSHRYRALIEMRELLLRLGLVHEREA